MTTKQPAVVRAATTLIVVSAVVTVIEAVSTLRNIGSEQTVAELNKGLSMGWATSSHLSITTLQHALEISANVSAVLAAAVAVLAIFARRGSRQSRIALTALALPVLIVCLLATGYAALGMVVGIGLLWTRNARPWFATASPAQAYAVSPKAAVSPTHAAYPTDAPTPPPPPALVGAPRPPRVTTAAVVSIVLSSLATVGGALGGIGLIALHGRPDLRQNVVDRLRDQQISMSLDDLNRYLTAATAAAAVIALLGALGIVAGALVLRGSPGARIALIVLSSICAVISLVAITSFVSVIWLVGAVSVIFGLAASDSVAWFKQH